MVTIPKALREYGLLAAMMWVLLYCLIGLSNAISKSINEKVTLQQRLEQIETNQKAMSRDLTSLEERVVALKRDSVKAEVQNETN